MRKEMALRFVAEKFKNHVAAYRDLGEVAILDWAKPRTSDNAVRIVFDKLGHTINVSGDLGWAVICPTCRCDLESAALSFRDVGYFAEKIKTSSHMYVYDVEAAKDELTARLLPESLPFEQRPLRVVLCKSILDQLGPDGKGPLDLITSDLLKSIDKNAYAWIGTVGKQYSSRVYFWMYTIQMAWEQIKGKKLPILHKVLELSTAHLTAETREFVDQCATTAASNVTAFRKEDFGAHYGWWVFCCDTDDVPEDLRRCVQYADANNAAWIEFDNDGPVYAELPVYED